MAPLLGIIGTIASVGGTLAAASAQKQQADYQAQVQRQQAAEKLAAATRDAADTGQKTNITKSNQLAVAAASGAGVTTPTVADILSNTAGRGEFLQQGDIYNGEAAAQDANNNATLLKMRGNAAMTGGLFDAAGAAASGIGKLASSGGGSWWS